MLRFGQRLRDARVEKGLTIEEVARATKIRSHFIESLERGEYAALPAAAYTVGFVKNYVAFLGLPLKQSLAIFRREYDHEESLHVLPQSFTNRKIQRKTLRLSRIFAVGALLFVLLLGYALFQYRYAFLNPSLTISSPTENQRITTDIIPISGTVGQNALVYVNGTSVLVDNAGHFQKNVGVFPGNDIIEVKAVNNFGRQTIIRRHIAVK